MRFDQEGESFQLARRGDRIVGCIGVSRDPYLPDPTVGRVRHLYVLPDERRHGVGQELLEGALKSARKCFPRLRLRTTTAAAARFYEALGFAPCDEPDATHSLTFFDVSRLTVEELAAFWFDRPSAEGDHDIWWRIEPTVYAGDRERYSTKLIELLRRFPELAAPYSFAQVQAGVWGLSSSTPYSAAQSLFSDRYWCDWVPSVESQVEAIGAMRAMFTDYLAKNEEGGEDQGFWMWWDMVIDQIHWHEPGAAELRQAIFEILCDILDLDDGHCQECALHGLGHLDHPQRSARVQRFIDQCEPAEWRMEWLEQCRDGTVL
jgi:N-acetylglutamate synthase-like GNAT family acetyltransferase